MDVEDTPRIVVFHDEELKYLTIYEAHDTAMSGNISREKTYGFVIQYYWWNKLYKRVSTYARMHECEKRFKVLNYQMTP